jgi:hypothetical protein
MGVAVLGGEEGFWDFFACVAGLDHSGAIVEDNRRQHVFHHRRANRQSGSKVDGDRGCSPLMMGRREFPRVSNRTGNLRYLHKAE